MDEPRPLEWRAVVALLANSETRAALAGLSDADSLTATRRERALRRWEQAGVITRDADGAPLVDEARLRATLSAVSPGARVGPQRFLSSDGHIHTYPARPAERHELLEQVIERVLTGEEVITEATLNERLADFTENAATLRRYLVDAGLLHRQPDGTGYHR